MDGSRELAQGIRANWPKPFGLALAWLLAALLAIGFGTFLSVSYALGAGLVLGICATGLWVHERRIPRCPHGKFGFVVAISVESPETYRIFERDFIHSLERLVCSGDMGRNIWFKSLSQIHLEKPLSDAAVAALRTKMRAGFILHGQVRTRQEGSKKHYMDLRGAVGHAETAEGNKKNLRMEFAELLPQRVIAPEGTELPAFEITSSLSSMVAKYIAGIAAFLSGHNDHAESLYSDALSLANAQNPKEDISKKIIERIPLRRGELSLNRALRSYTRWKTSRNEDDLRSMLEALRQAPARIQKVPSWKALMAIGLVASSHGNYTEIEKTVAGSPPSDPVTQMNLAFFDIARGDLRSATRHYRRAKELDVSLETLDEVICFLEWFRGYRSELFVESSFALGYIAFCLLEDRGLTEEFFADFRAQRGNRYVSENELVTKWLFQLSS